jgi:hypothetical protein
MAAEAAARDEDAVAKTDAIERRVTELETFCGPPSAGMRASASTR